MSRKLVVRFGAWGALLLTANVGCSIYTEDLLKSDDGGVGGSGGSSGNLGGSADSGGTVGTGGGNSGGTNPGTGGQGGSAAGVLELIDNMEDGNTTIRFIDKRTGNWDVANDGAVDGTQEPAPGFTKMVADSGAPDSQYAAYTKGEGFGWASLNVSMLNGLVAYDATAYQGLSFKAKVGAGSVTTVRVRVVTADTDPKGGVCGDTPAPACYDHFATEIDLTVDWDTYELYFEDFGQLAPAFESVNLSQVYYFEFYFDGSSPFELWVDDLSFIKN